jgi:hypothetical protein
MTRNYGADIWQYGVSQDLGYQAFLDSTRTLPIPILRYPSYNDFVPSCPSITRAKFQPILIAGFPLDDGPETIIDLVDYPDNMRINPILKEIMLAHGRYLFTTDGLVNVSVYVNDVRLDKDFLSIDENLHLTVAVKNKLKRYNVVISEATDLRQISPQFLQLLIKYRSFYPLTILRNIETLIKSGFFKIDGSNGYLLFIMKMFQLGLIDGQVADLILLGHITASAYGYMQTVEQFADYLLTTQSLISPDMMSDVYIEYCISKGLISNTEVSFRNLLTKYGYPVLTQNRTISGGAINLPLRIFRTTIIPAKETQHV